MTALTVIALGFFLGMRHATDADHVVAVTTIVSRHRSVKGAALIGAAWGLGHTVTLLVVGGGIVLFGWVIPPRLGLSLELSVGIMLILLGAVALATSVRRIPEVLTSIKPAGESDHEHSHVDSHVHSHAHPHGDYVHTHAHRHDAGQHPHDPQRTPVSWMDRRFGSVPGYRYVRPLAVGLVHGLAGSAAVALLVLAAIPDPGWAVAYLAVFGVGTIAGMMLVTAMLGVPFAATGNRQALQQGLRVASGALSIGLGLFIAYDVGVVQGLFGGAASLTLK
ncbi:MAG: high-affinity nickel-transport family protein [Gemmatimonadaceae bacterium]